MRIAIVGTGYVGLVSGACFAELGHMVACLDTNAEKIARLRRGEIPIYEPGLEALVARNARAGRLLFETEPGSCIPGAEVVFIAVGTPASRSDAATASRCGTRIVYRAHADVAPGTTRGVATASRSASS